MKINYTARHAQLNPDIKKYCEKRIMALERFVGHPIEADVLLSIEKYRQKVDINLKTKIATLNTVEETHDMFSSLVGAFDHLEKRLKREREKLREKKRRRIKEPQAYSSGRETGEKPKRVVRSQSYSMKPMSLEEAIVQLETRKEEVFLFRTLDAESWAVLYRRKDGNYGLVESR
jgi:putative sigma-54 modulation protein